MALIIPDSFDFEGADWEHPDPFDSRYWNALYEACRERFPELRREFSDENVYLAVQGGAPVFRVDADAPSGLPFTGIPRVIAEYLKRYIQSASSHTFCTPHFYDTGTFEFPYYMPAQLGLIGYEFWSIPAMEQKIGKLPLPETLPELLIDSAEFLVQAKKALELLTVMDVTSMDYRLHKWKYTSISASTFYRWDELSSGSYDWPTFWNLAITRFQNELSDLKLVGTSENSPIAINTTSNVTVNFELNFAYGEPNHGIAIYLYLDIPEIEFCEKMNGRRYVPSIFVSNVGDLPIYLPEISPEKKNFRLTGKTQNFQNPNFNLSSVFELPEEPTEGGVIFSREASLTFDMIFADFRTEGGFKFR